MNVKAMQSQNLSREFAHALAKKAGRGARERRSYDACGRATLDGRSVSNDPSTARFSRPPH